MKNILKQVLSVVEIGVPILAGIEFAILANSLVLGMMVCCGIYIAGTKITGR